MGDQKTTMVENSGVCLKRIQQLISVYQDQRIHVLQRVRRKSKIIDLCVIEYLTNKSIRYLWFLTFFSQQQSRKRRCIHRLVKISTLIGFTITAAALLFYVMSDHGFISMDSADCDVSGSLYRTGINKAYLMISLDNLGSKTITTANITFVDDDGTQ